jgi:hypothetical protein
MALVWCLSCLSARGQSWPGSFPLHNSALCRECACNFTLPWWEGCMLAEGQGWSSNALSAWYGRAWLYVADIEITSQVHFQCGHLKENWDMQSEELWAKSRTGSHQVQQSWEFNCSEKTFGILFPLVLGEGLGLRTFLSSSCLTVLPSVYVTEDNSLPLAFFEPSFSALVHHPLCVRFSKLMF